MSTPKSPQSGPAFSRRDFLKVAGAALGAAAASRFSPVRAGANEWEVGPVPLGYKWWYGLPHWSEKLRLPVIPRMIQVIGETDPDLVEIPCQILGRGTVEFPSSGGVWFEGGGYLRSLSACAPGEPQCLSLQEQFSLLGFPLDSTVLVSGTDSYFQVQASGPNFPVITSPRGGSLCVPQLFLVNAQTPTPQIVYGSPAATEVKVAISQSGPFDPAFLQEVLHVTQVTQATDGQPNPGFPGQVGVNYWHGPLPPGLISNDNSAPLCAPFTLRTDLLDDILIGASPDLRYFAEGLLTSLYVDPRQCVDN